MRTQSNVAAKAAASLLALCSLFAARLAFAQAVELRGTVTDAEHRPVAGVLVDLRSTVSATLHTATDAEGRFDLGFRQPGSYTLHLAVPHHPPLTRQLKVSAGAGPQEVEIHLSPSATETITVTADTNRVDLLAPDPSEKVFVRDDLLEANPGRPGVPVSLPGYPAETASGGIKAPQYFAPGVAGDHGEPIAQYIAVGGYLLPNNLSANAHGNGYADPNMLIPSTLASVEVNGGAFNVLEGNHAVNLAAIYGVRPDLLSSLTLTADPRDVDLLGTYSAGRTSWVAGEASYGNGFLRRLEHRQQYKLNTQRILDTGAHHLTLLGIAYYGKSNIPGLVPVPGLNAGQVQALDLGDTIDPRQKDQTHTSLVAVNDVWSLTPAQQLQGSAFFRTYNLALFSNFGDGLIRQSEFRTVAGASLLYANHLSEHLAVLAGTDLQREAPRRDDLDRYGPYIPGNRSEGPFIKVDSNNLTITPVAPYAAAQGSLGGHVRYYAGWRRDEIDFNNQDLLTPTNSFHGWTGVNSPKATLSITPGPAKWAPILSGSFGEAFFTEDPRIGTGTTRGTPVSRAHSYELVTTKMLGSTDLKLILGHVTTSEELAKIDPDTGLQEDQGPGRLRFLTATARQHFAAGSVLFTFSKADARDVNSGQPTAEAPRTIVDVLGDLHHLPLRLQAKAEFEYVGAKPLGTGCAPDPNAQCVGVPVREVRAALARPWDGGRLLVGLNVLVASGYSGQTLEVFSPSTFAAVTGVRIPSNASLSVSYRFGEHSAP